MSQQKKLEGKGTKGGKEVPSRSASLFFRPSRNSAAHRQWSQDSTGDNVVDTVTQAEGGIRAAMTGGTICEAVTRLIVFFGGSVAKDFLQIGASSEYRMNLQTTKYNVDGEPPWEVLELEIRERLPSTLRNVDGGPPGRCRS
jgi:hypothetical protein